MRTAALLIIAIVSLSSWPAAAPAAHEGGRRWPAEALAEGRLSLEDAVARAEKRYGARAVRAEERREGNRIVYRIRLLTADGRVVDVTVDPDSGEIR